MKKEKAFRILSFILLFSMILTVGASAASFDAVAPCSNSYIDSGFVSISQSGKTVTVSFTIYGTGFMTRIGASCIKLYTSDGTLVKTFWSSSYSTMLGSNRYNYSSSVTYNGNSNTSYYAVVTCYAANSSGSGTQQFTTGTT